MHYTLLYFLSNHYVYIGYTSCASPTPYENGSARNTVKNRFQVHKPELYIHSSTEGLTFVPNKVVIEDLLGLHLPARTLALRWPIQH